MKKEYLHPDLEIIYVISRDIIALSVEENEPGIGGGTGQQDFDKWFSSFMDGI